MPSSTRPAICWEVNVVCSEVMASLLVAAGVRSVLMMRSPWRSWPDRFRPARDCAAAHGGRTKLGTPKREPAVLQRYAAVEQSTRCPDRVDRPGWTGWTPVQPGERKRPKEAPISIDLMSSEGKPAPAGLLVRVRVHPVHPDVHRCQKLARYAPDRSVPPVGVRLVHVEGCVH